MVSFPAPPGKPTPRRGLVGPRPRSGARRRARREGGPACAAERGNLRNVRVPGASRPCLHAPRGCEARPQAALRRREIRQVCCSPAGHQDGRPAALALPTPGPCFSPRGDLLRVRYFTHDPELQASPARTPRPPRSLPSRGCWPCRFTPPCPSGFTRRSSTGRAAGGSRAKARPLPSRHRRDDSIPLMEPGRRLCQRHVEVSVPGGLANYTPHLNFLYFQSVLH